MVEDITLETIDAKENIIIEKLDNIITILNTHETILNNVLTKLNQITPQTDTTTEEEDEQTTQFREELEAKINGMGIRFVNDFADYVKFDINKCLLHGDPDIIVKLEKILSEKYKDILGIFRSEAFFLEIVPKGVDKALSIDRLLDLIDIPTEQCIACGDGFNDISMIKYAGLGVAMSNAKQPVKEAADYITLSNDQDGIAHLLKKIVRKGSVLPDYKYSVKK